MARRHKKQTPVTEATIIVVVGLALLLGSEEYTWFLPAAITAIFMGCLVYIAWRVVSAMHKQRVEQAYSIADIDDMDGIAFEHYLAGLLRSCGYTRVRVTERVDLGVDIVAHKDGVAWGIQAKRYSRPVSASAVRQVYTALNHYKCNRAMVITNNTFTRPAQQLARTNRCVLVGRDELQGWVYAYSQHEKSSDTL